MQIGFSSYQASHFFLYLTPLALFVLGQVGELTEWLVHWQQTSHNTRSTLRVVTLNANQRARGVDTEERERGGKEPSLEGW